VRVAEAAPTKGRLPPRRSSGTSRSDDTGVENLRGKLLIAGPGLFDPNFRRTVVLVGEHNDEGALGVVINRPTEVRVHEAIPPLGAMASNGLLFVGGPVQPQAAVVLAEFRHPDAGGLMVFDSIGFLRGEVEEESALAVTRARVFAGYAGWGPGQLETEMEAGGWIVEPALPGDVFTDDPGRLWSDVLRRKGGQYAVLALMPFDPRTN
jgi:putative transcriptional regulator